MMFVWRRHTTIILIVGFVLILIALVAAFITENYKPTTRVHMGSAVYDLMVADSQVEREQGLSGVTELPRNGGLLMQFESDDLHGIWMKGMKIPLDIIWLDNNKKVVYIVRNASPESSTRETFRPNDPARYVIELPAGSVQTGGIKKGMTAAFNEGDTE